MPKNKDTGTWEALNIDTDRELAKGPRQLSPTKTDSVLLGSSYDWFWL